MSLFFILFSALFIVLSAHYYSKDKANIAVVLIGLWCFSLGLHTAVLISSLI